MYDFNKMSILNRNMYNNASDIHKRVEAINLIEIIELFNKLIEFTILTNSHILNRFNRIL